LYHIILSHYVFTEGNTLQALNINDVTPTNIVLQSTMMVMEESCRSKKKLKFKSKLQHQSSEKQRLTELERLVF
jgi:hypothetical protein